MKPVGLDGASGICCPESLRIPMLHDARLPLIAAMTGLLACPAPCPDQPAPEASSQCAREEPGEVFIKNSSFEAADPLDGWHLLEADGVTATTRPGVDGCTALSLITPSQPLVPAARIITKVDAEHLRGQRVRLSLWARMDLKGKKGSVLVLRAGGSRWKILELNGTEIAGDHWRLHSVELDVPQDTDRLEIQVGLSRVHRIDLDGVAINRIGPACPGCEAPAPLTADQRENLITLTHRLGVWYDAHPGAEAEAETTDRDALAMIGVQTALRATSPDALAISLDEVFAPDGPTPVLDKPEGFTADGGDRTTRLAAIALFGARVGRRSPRLGQLDQPWDDVLRASFERVALANDRYGLRKEVFRLFTALHEGTGQGHIDWDAWLMFRLDLRWQWAEDQLVIIESNPLLTPDLQIGDVVEAIDGRTPADALADLLPFAFGGTAARSRLIATDLLNRSSSARQLQVRHLDGSERTIKIPVRMSRSLPPRPGIIDLAGDIVFVRLAYATVDDLHAAAGRLQAARGVIFDARSGLEKGVLESFRATLGDVGGDPPREGSTADPVPVELPARIAVLIDERTTGAVESLADALRAQRGALLVGTASAAAPGTTTESSLPGGLKLLMTESPYRYASGQSEFEPLEPDILVAPTIAGIAASRDEPLERALAALAAD
jgi:hypothetical protein